MTVEAKNRMAVVAVLSSLSYSFCSVSMVMSNKARAPVRSAECARSLLFLFQFIFFSIRSCSF